jgi:hypothetical protein
MSYSMHYCGEEFQRINLFAETKTCCPSEEPMPGCCDDVSNLELPNADQQVSDLLDFQPIPFQVICPELGNYSVLAPEISQDLTLWFADTSPPSVSKRHFFSFTVFF